MLNNNLDTNNSVKRYKEIEQNLTEARLKWKMAEEQKNKSLEDLKQNTITDETLKSIYEECLNEETLTNERIIELYNILEQEDKKVMEQIEYFNNELVKLSTQQ